MGSAMALDGARQKLVGSEQESNFARREAKRFASELGRLKGSYVKIGQMLAMFGEHFLPPVLAEALHDLEDKTLPLPWEELEPTVRAELGDRYELLVIDPEPLAAASLAQVHRAKIQSSGEEICLKIQYPDLARVIDADFDGVIRMLRAARWLKVGRDIDEWLEQMRGQLHNEIDYQREAAMTEMMRKTVNAHGLDRSQHLQHEAAKEVNVSPLGVPKVYPEFSSPRLLALEYCDGASVKHTAVTSLPLAARNSLSVAMLRLFFYEVFEWGLMQTDPNFGNYLIELDAKNTTARLVLLDFGSSLELSETQRTNLKRVIKGGLDRSEQEVETGLKGLGWLSENANPEAVSLFIKFCYHLLEPLRPSHEQASEYLNGDGHYRWSDSELMMRVGKKGIANATTRHFELPAKDFSLFARKLTGVFTFIAYLRAEFCAHDVIQDFIADI